MAFSLPQVESKVQFSPLPKLDIEQGHQDKTDIVDIYDKGFESSRDSLVASMRLAVIGVLLSILAIYVKPFQEHSNPIQSKFFDNSSRVSNFNISDGELSTNQDVSLTLINVMDDNNIRIGTMDVASMYEENEILAEVTPVEQYNLFENEGSLVEIHEEKRMNFKFSTTGCQKEQPIVDNTIFKTLQEIGRRE